MSLKLYTHAFSNGGSIPQNFTAEGANTSPFMQWEGWPIETKSFALVCLDNDASSGSFCHWLVYDIPVGTSSLDAKLPHEEMLSNGMKQGVNDFGNLGYTGPLPPPGKSHTYHFRLYALKNPPGLNVAMRKDELLPKLDEMQILATAEYTGTYKSFKKAKKAA